MNNVVQRVLEFVRQNKLLEACELLEKRFPDVATLLSAQIHELNQAIRRNTIDFHKYQIEVSKIRTSILDLTKNYEESSHLEYKKLVQSSKEIFEKNKLKDNNLIEEANQIIDEFAYWREAGVFLFERRYEYGSNEPILDKFLIEELCDKWPRRCRGKEEVFLKFTTEFLEFLHIRLSSGEDMEGEVYEKICRNISPADRDMIEHIIDALIEDIKKVGPVSISIPAQKTLLEVLNHFKYFYKD